MVANLQRASPVNAKEASAYISRTRANGSCRIRDGIRGRRTMHFAKRVFLLAGAAGILLVAPGYFLERWAGGFDPPAVNHPEFYYGFVGIVLVFQFLYLLIAPDPSRFRPVM